VIVGVVPRLQDAEHAEAPALSIHRPGVGAAFLVEGLNMHDIQVGVALEQYCVPQTERAVIMYLIIHMLTQGLPGHTIIAALQDPVAQAFGVPRRVVPGNDTAGEKSAYDTTATRVD